MMKVKSKKQVNRTETDNTKHNVKTIKKKNSKNIKINNLVDKIIESLN